MCNKFSCTSKMMMTVVTGDALTPHWAHKLETITLSKFFRNQEHAVGITDKKDAG